jgi:iron complex outermembrane receptor protein
LGKIGNAKDTGNRFSASYIDQFADRTIGIALGYAHLETPMLDNETGLYEPWKRDARRPAGRHLRVDGIKAVARSGENQRDGLMGVLQYRPNKQWTSILDVYASRFKAEETANQLEISLEQATSRTTIRSSQQRRDRQRHTQQRASPLVRGMYNKRKDDIRAVGWSNEFRNTASPCRRPELLEGQARTS